MMKNSRIRKIHVCVLKKKNYLYKINFCTSQYFNIFINISGYLMYGVEDFYGRVLDSPYNVVFQRLPLNCKIYFSKLLESGDDNRRSSDARNVRCLKIRSGSLLCYTESKAHYRASEAEDLIFQKEKIS